MFDPTTVTREEVTELIRLWRQARTARLEQDKIAAAYKDQEMLFKSDLIAAIQAQKYEGIVVDGRTTGVSTGMQAVVDDREALVNYILDARAIDLLQFRLSATAVRDREESGIKVPGIGYMEKYDLFDRKA